MESKENYIPESRGIVKIPDPKTGVLSPRTNQRSDGWEMGNGMLEQKHSM